MQASRPKPAMLEGLSRFLILHERCSAGFDVSHPAGVGSGRVSIVCRGCGAQHEYLTSTIEIQREVQFQVRASDSVPATPATIPQGDLAGLPRHEPPTAAEEAPPPPAAPAAEKRRIGGLTGARAGTAALLLIALTALIFAIVRLAGNSSDNKVATTAGGPAGEGATTPAQPPAAPQPTPAETPGLRKVTTQSFSISAPAGWRAKSIGTALRLAPGKGAGAMVRVYSDKRPDLSLSEMGRLSGQLLRREHPGGSLSSIRRTAVGGTAALKVRVRFKGGSESALAIAHGAFRYLLLVSVSSNASAATRRDAADVVASLRPS
jgi:hypothetical protein